MFLKITIIILLVPCFYHLQCNHYHDPSSCCYTASANVISTKNIMNCCSMISKLSHHHHHHHHNENNKRSHHKDNDTSSIEACLMDVYLYKQLITETITTSTRSSSSSSGSSSSSSSSSTSKASDGRIKDISKLTSKFIIITYSTNSIIDYTLYSFGINALYAHSKSQHHHHHQDHNPVDATINIYSTSPSGGFEYESRDQRWNKVKIIEVLLSQLQQQYRNQSTSSSSSSSSSLSSASSSSSQVEYIIWMDSDLIILNFDFDFNHITTRYPTADIIISRDAYPDNGMVNTGMINYTS